MLKPSGGTISERKDTWNISVRPDSGETGSLAKENNSVLQVWLPRENAVPRFLKIITKLNMYFLAVRASSMQILLATKLIGPVKTRILTR